MNQTTRWETAYARRLFVTDTIVVLLAVFGSQSIWFGLDPVDVAGRGSTRGLSYTVVSLVFIAGWLLSLSIFATRDPKVTGIGSDEYRRIADATIRLFGVLAIIAFLVQLELARGYFLTALPGGLALLLISRWAWRKWLHDHRRRGELVYRALVVGSRSTASRVARDMTRERAAGLTVVGLLVPGGGDSSIEGFPVLGELTDVAHTLASTGADTVVLSGADEMSHESVRNLSWELERLEVQLIVAPALTDIAGPRIHTRPIAGLPLIHVEFPKFEGRQYAFKRAFDVAFALTAIAITSPLLFALAVVVKVTSPGPIIYRQERVGIDGRAFHVLKFRSMRDKSDDQLAALLAAQGEGDQPLFKITDDPRVTPIGAWLRRFSLDELPQFFNVLRGDMSVVGPRPQRPAEVALYDDTARRRLIVQPGITGLWQVSGRSNLGWEDALRLDLFYVENWSLLGDLVIIYRTVLAVIRAEGAV